MSPATEKYRHDIAKKVRELRRGRHWTQKRLAQLLGLSQNRLSEIEGGRGSFTAEQLLLLAKQFNVPASSFVSEKARPDPSIQNALARHGAQHLREDDSTLPSEKLDNVIHLVREVLIAPDSPRAVAGLAPVLVQHAEPPLLNRLRLRFIDDGVIQRFGWLLENTRWGVSEELKEKDLSEDWRRKYKKADLVLGQLLSFPGFAVDEKSEREDVIDSVLFEDTLEKLRSTSSDISRRWKVITRLQPTEFARALKEARESY